MSFSLTNQFLIAMPGMQNPNFTKSLTLICEHNDDGALGFVINHPTQIPVGELLSQQEIDYDDESELPHHPLYSGGPVETDRGFILHSQEKTWSSTLAVGDKLCITASRDIIEDCANGKGPNQSLFLLGYSGWGAGQLEHEISENTWLTTTADPHIIFNMPADKRWRAAAQDLGVDLDLLNTNAGHA